MWLSFSPCVCVRFLLLSSVSLSRLFILCSSAIVLVHLCSSTTRWFVLWYKKKERRQQTDTKKKKSRSAARYLFFLNCVSYLDCASCTYYAYTWMSTIYIFIYFRASPWHTHKRFYDRENNLHLCFFSVQFWVFVVSLVRFRVWDSPVDSAQNVIIKLNIASITHSQLILVSCFIFLPSFASLLCIPTSLVSFSSDRYNVGDLLCFQMKREKNVRILHKAKHFIFFVVVVFFFISLKTFIKCHFYGDEKSSHNENLRCSSIFCCLIVR